MTTISKYTYVATLLLAGYNGVLNASLAETAVQQASTADISSDWIKHVTWHHVHSNADLWAPGEGAGTWAAFSEFYSPKYDAERIPLALTIANADFAGNTLFAQPLRNSTELMSIELVEAAEADLPNVQISESFDGTVIQPTQLFALSADWADKLRNQKGRLQFELRGIVGTFTRRAKIPLNGPLRIDLPDQSVGLQITEGTKANSFRREEDWQKFHVVIIKTIVPKSSSESIRKKIRCYFLVDPETNHGALLGIMRYGTDSSPLNTPAGLDPSLTGDERSFDVPEKISLKNKELYIYEFVPDHPFDIRLTDPDFVMDIPPDSSN